MAAGIERYHRRNVLFLSVVEIFWGMGLAFSHARIILPAYLDDLKASNLLLGVLAAVWMLGSSIPQAFGAYFTEHLPTKKRVVILFHFIPPAAWLALFVYNYFFVTGPASYQAAKVFFILVCTFYACSLGVLLPIYFGFISRVVSEKRRGRAFGTIFSAQSMFGALAVCCLGFVLAGISFPRNYAFLFFLTFTAICIGNLFFLPVREPRDTKVKHKKTVGEYVRSFITIFRRKRGLRNYVFVRLLTALNMLLVFFYVKYAKSELPWLNAEHIRYFVVVLLLSQSLGNLVFGRLGDRFGFRLVAAAGAVLMLCAAAFAVICGTITGFYMAIAAAGFYLAADWISHLNIVLQLSGSGQHTKDLGFIGITTSLPLALVSLLLGYFIDIFSFGAVAFVTSFLAMLGVLLLFLIKMPRQEKVLENIARGTH